MTYACGLACILGLSGPNKQDLITTKKHSTPPHTALPLRGEGTMNERSVETLPFQVHGFFDQKSYPSRHAFFQHPSRRKNVDRDVCSHGGVISRLIHICVTGLI